MKVVILCGGSGTRLWPISRTLYPKQFVKIFENESLFQKTVRRNEEFTSSYTVVINQEQYFMGVDQFEEIANAEKTRFILEPIGKNTAPAIAMAAFEANPDDVLLVVPSDHLIHHQSEYRAVVNQAKALAEQDQLVTFGIKPHYPETGYGYIEASEFNVKSFKEKPNSDDAKSYLEAGNFFWNSGMFCFKAGVYLKELKEFAPDIYRDSQTAFLNARKDKEIRLALEDMNTIRAESIDYAVMEKSKIVKVVPSDIGWSDLGSFDSLYETLPRDENGNTLGQKAIHIESRNNLILSHDRIISTIDIEDLMIVDTQDALVVAKKGSTQKVKELVGEIKKQNPDLAHVHTTAHRPWGTYTVLENGESYKVKQISVRPGAKLSLQYHHHRSEHWIVVSGTATVTINDKTFDLKQNESTFIPKGAKHRLANNQQAELIIIEAQVGNYLGEDDIIRIQDDYRRN